MYSRAPARKLTAAHTQNGSLMRRGQLVEERQHFVQRLNANARVITRAHIHSASSLFLRAEHKNEVELGDLQARRTQ
jgi:hypothetical protein